MTGDGGSAFPIPEDESNVRTYGMSLRDYFAGQALVSLVSDKDITGDIDVARAAYDYADAMLAVRREVA